MKEIQLTQGKIAIVDDEDYDLVSKHKWHYIRKQCSSPGYASTHIDRKCISMHRLIVVASGGKVIDHKNGDTLDNRRSNLRICEHRENIRNQRKRKPSLSKYKGLAKGKGRKYWQVQIGVNGKKITVGNFEDEEEAARAYDKAARQYYGEFAATNFED